MENHLWARTAWVDLPLPRSYSATYCSLLVTLAAHICGWAVSVFMQVVPAHQLVGKVVEDEGLRPCLALLWPWSHNYWDFAWGKKIGVRQDMESLWVLAKAYGGRWTWRIAFMHCTRSSWRFSHLFHLKGFVSSFSLKNILNMWQQALPWWTWALPLLLKLCSYGEDSPMLIWPKRGHQRNFCEVKWCSKGGEQGVGWGMFSVTIKMHVDLQRVVNKKLYPTVNSFYRSSIASQPSVQGEMHAVGTRNQNLSW